MIMACSVEQSQRPNMTLLQQENRRKTRRSHQAERKDNIDPDIEDGSSSNTEI